MSIEKFSLVHPLRVRWAEADIQGVVFNAHYLAYFDIAITEYWRVLAKGDDELQVAVRCARLGRSSMAVDFEIHRSGEHLISGQSIYVYAKDAKSLPIPDDLRRRIHGFEKIPPL